MNKLPNVSEGDRETRGYSRVATSTLDVNGHPSVRAGVLFNVLHVLSTDHTETTAAHLLVDARAQSLDRLPDLPLAIVSAEVCGDELLIAGEDALERVMLTSVGSDGSERWSAPLAVGPLVTRAPRVLVADHRAIVVWEESEDDQSVLLVSAVRNASCDPPRRFVLPGVTHDVDFAHTSEGLVIARLSGLPPRSSLLRLDESSNLTSIDLDEVGASPIAIAAVAGGVALAWGKGQTINVREFDSSLRALSDSVSFDVPGGAIKRLRGYGPDRPAFVATSWKGKPGGRNVASTEKARSHVLLDGSVLEVPQPVGWIETGGWLEQTFVLVHGDGPMSASAFSPET